MNSASAAYLPAPINEASITGFPFVRSPACGPREKYLALFITKIVCLSKAADIPVWSVTPTFGQNKLSDEFRQGTGIVPPLDVGREWGALNKNPCSFTCTAFILLYVPCLLVLSLAARISEESEQLPYEERRDYDYCWVVDPLDGTKVTSLNALSV